MTQVNSSMNFLPEDYVEKRQAARSAVVFIGLLLFVVSGVVGAYFYSQMSMKGIFAERDKSRADIEAASARIAKWQEMEHQKEEMVRKAEITTTLMERVKRSALLTELTKLRPGGVNFVAIDLKTKDVTPGGNPKPATDLEKARAMQEGRTSAPKPPTSDVTINVIGTAPTDAEVAAYMTKLQDSDLLTSVALMYSEEFLKDKDEATKPIRRFSVEMHVNPNADLRGGQTASVEKGPKDF
jgi:Tfp pilus assembly protein PilN